MQGLLMFLQAPGSEFPNLKQKSGDCWNALLRTIYNCL